MQAGRMTAAGPTAEVLTADALAGLYGLDHDEILRSLPTLARDG